MNETNLMLVIWSIAIVAAGVAIFQFDKIRKRPAKTDEFKRHVNVLLSDTGCDKDETEKRLNRCKLLVKRYGINLAGLNYKKIFTVDELTLAAAESLERHYDQLFKQEDSFRTDIHRLISIPKAQIAEHDVRMLEDLRTATSKIADEMCVTIQKANLLRQSVAR